MLTRNIGLDQRGKLRERFLPAEIAHLHRNDARNPLLHDVQLASAGHRFQGHRNLHFTGEIRVVEAVGVANALMWHQFLILPAKGSQQCGFFASAGAPCSALLISLSKRFI